MRESILALLREKRALEISALAVCGEIVGAEIDKVNLVVLSH